MLELVFAIYTFGQHIYGRQCYFKLEANYNILYLVIDVDTNLKTFIYLNFHNKLKREFSNSLKKKF